MHSRATTLFCVFCLALCACPSRAQEQKRLITGKIDESKLVTLGGNTTPAATRAEFDRGAVPDDTRFEHLLLLLKRDPDTEARVKPQIDAMHDPASPQFHRWLTAEQFGARFGVHPLDSEAIQEWLKSHGFTVNQAYKNGYRRLSEADSRNFQHGDAQPGFAQRRQAHRQHSRSASPCGARPRH
jgi:hypothetical protein